MRCLPFYLWLRLEDRFYKRLRFLQILVQACVVLHKLLPHRGSAGVKLVRTRMRIARARLWGYVVQRRARPLLASCFRRYFADTLWRCVYCWLMLLALLHYSVVVGFHQFVEYVCQSLDLQQLSQLLNLRVALYHGSK